jgi:hypothetical protein
MNRAIVGVFCLIALPAGRAEAAGEKLYGVHWWDYANPNVGAGPQGGWSVETIVTESDPWWRAPFFVPLYQQVTSTHNAEIVTRIDYNWGQTVPAPASSSAQNWANKVVSDVIGPLGPYAHRWIIGNEPNIIGEGNGWTANQVTPSGYAQIYYTVRQTIKAQRPQDEVLFAPVSPGGVIPGVRWKDGGQWLGEAIDATLALSGGAIDGFAIHSYGNPFAGAMQAVTDFHNTFESQLSVIDGKQLQGAAVYLTEWNRATATTGNLAANEQVSADFLRLSLLDVDAWNRRPGNHNIRSLAWFVHNKDYGDWNQYSLEWWQSQGNPVGHAGDLWTALMNSSTLPAGLVGTRPVADYDGDGMVTANDYTAWRANFGRTDWVYADGNRNGRVDAADYVLWRKSVSASAAATAANPVPEGRNIWHVLAGVIAMATLYRGGRIRKAAGPVAALGLLFMAGCSRQPGRVSMAHIDPSAAADQAMEIYDANADRKLSDEELKSVPGILKWKSLYDLDSDGCVTNYEIAQRIRKWQADKIGFQSISANVKLNGRPVPDVEVVLTPEPYLGEAAKPAAGVTNARGYATLAVSPDDLPATIKRRNIQVSGIYPGTYKIKLSHPQERLPDVSAEGVALGDEVAQDTVETSIDIALSSR